MRKVTYGINISIDGCCDHTKFSGGDDILEYFKDLMQDVDLIVYGRKTYELMIPYWPEAATDPTSRKAEQEYGQAFDAIDKLVFSHTLTDADDKRTRLTNSNPADEIQKLKQQPGKTISIGGVDLASQIVAAGLVDEFYIVVHPVIVGEGKRLFDYMQLKQNLQLQLAETKQLVSGAIAMRFVR